MNDWNVIEISSGIAITYFSLCAIIKPRRPDSSLAENLNHNNNNNCHSSTNDHKSQNIKDMRRRSPSQERTTGSPAYSNGGGGQGAAVNCAGNGNGLLGSHGTESNSSRVSNCSIGSSASSTSSRGGAGEHSDRSSLSREDNRATTPNCNAIVGDAAFEGRLLIQGRSL